MGDIINDVKEMVTGKPIIVAIFVVIGFALGTALGDKVKSLFRKGY